MNTRQSIWLAVLVCVAAPVSAQGRDSVFDSLVAEALQRNPTLAQRQAAGRAATFRIRPAGALPDPMLSLGVMDLVMPHFEFNRSDFTEVDAELSQEIPWLGTLGARSDAARAAAVGARAEEGATRRSVTVALAEAYYRLRYAVSALATVHRQLRLLDAAVQLTTTRYATGTAPQSDPLQAKLQRDRLQSEAFALESERVSALAAVNALRNRAPGDSLQVDALDASGVRATAALLPSTDSLTVLALAGHPRRAARQAAVEQATRLIQVERLGARPDFTLTVRYGYRPPFEGQFKFPDFFSAFVGVRLPIWAWRKQNRLADAARADSTAAAAELRDTELQLSREVTEAAAIDRRGDTAMKRIVIGLLGIALSVSGCRQQRAQDAARAGMPGMKDTTPMAGISGGGDTAGVPIDRSEAARLGITFARAAERPIQASVRAVGVLKYAEPRLVYVNARVNGWVEQLYADYVGKHVTAGEPLLALYSPELVSAQEEYLLARRLRDDTLAASARRRLALWDIPADQIDSLEVRGSVTRTLMLRAPRSGELVEKNVIEGQAVQSGMNLFLIADRSVLWVDLAIFEQDAASVQVGTPTTITVDALPGRTFRGHVTFIYPQLDDKTRTLTARVEVENPDGALRPGMYAAAQVARAGRRAVSVPLTAVLPTGTKDLVFVNRGDGRFAPREVRVGARGDSLIEVVQGLQPGDEVVASATYLLDSESNLASAIQGLMLQMGMGLNMGGMHMEQPRNGKRESGKVEKRP